MGRVQRTIMGTIPIQRRLEWYLMSNWDDPVEPDNRWSAKQSFLQYRDHFKQQFYQQFRTDWNPNHFRWNSHDEIDLIRNFSNYFPAWWDPYLFVWKLKTDNPCWQLSFSCSDWFEVWFDPDKFDYTMCSSCLVNIFYNEFEIWWNPDKFIFDRDTANILELNCQQFKDIWAPYYVEWKLLNE